MIAGRSIHELLLLLRFTTMRLHVRKSAHAGRLRCSAGLRGYSQMPLPSATS